MKRTTRPPIVTAPEWRSLVKRGTVAGIARAGIVKREGDSVSFIASSADSDRYGDTVVQAGGKLENFKRNPVILWAHSHSTPPVAKAPAVALNADGNLSTGPLTFTTEEEHPFGAQVGRMVKGGFLNAVSIGFLPLKWEERYDEGGRFLGYNFLEWELIEISVVPVPANPQALIEGKGLGDGFAIALSKWVETPDESAPLARSFQHEVRGFMRAAEEVQTRAEEASDEGAFAEMLTLMRRQAEATEKLVTLLQKREVEAATPAPVETPAEVAPAPAADVPSLCPTCGAEGGTNIDCETCAPVKGSPSMILRAFAGADLVREEPRVQDAPEGIAGALLGLGGS